MVSISQISVDLSSHEAKFVAVGENEQCRTQLLCFFNEYCNLLSTVDQTFTSLSSPQEANNKPSQEKLNALILALCALINVVYFPEH